MQVSPESVPPAEVPAFLSVQPSKIGIKHSGELLTKSFGRRGSPKSLSPPIPRLQLPQPSCAHPPSRYCDS